MVLLFFNFTCAKPSVEIDKCNLHILAPKEGKKVDNDSYEHMAIDCG